MKSGDPVLKSKLHIHKTKKLCIPLIYSMNIITVPLCLYFMAPYNSKMFGCRPDNPPQISISLLSNLLVGICMAKISHKNTSSHNQNWSFIIYYKCLRQSIKMNEWAAVKTKWFSMVLKVNGVQFGLLSNWQTVVKQGSNLLILCMFTDSIECMKFSHKMT